MKIEIDTDSEIITIDDMPFSFEFFSAFSHPDPQRLYSFEEVGGAVVATLVSTGEDNA